MEADATNDSMTEEGRALLTDREKEILSGEAEVTDNYKYKVQSTVRVRIRKHLGEDVEFLAEHFPEAHELVVGRVCENNQEQQEHDSNPD